MLIRKYVRNHLQKTFGPQLETLEPRTMLAGDTINPMVLERADFNADQILNDQDIDLLSAAVRSNSNDLRFDANRDDIVSESDRALWVNTIRRTYFGDANLDGVFGTGDLVSVFQAGVYEDDIAENATWKTGDWNGDFDFNTSDLVVAFQAGGFEKGLRAISKVSIDLAPEFDSDPVGDLQTTVSQVALAGQSDPFAVVSVMETNAMAFADADGRFQVENVRLSRGGNEFTIMASDIWGQTSQVPLNIALIPDIFLSEDARFATEGAKIVELNQDAGSRKIRFEVVVDFDTEADAILEDALLVYLVDPANPTTTILDGGIPGSALFSLANGRSEYSAGRVRFDGTFVEIDVTEVLGFDNGQLAFQLINHDLDEGTNVAIYDISVITDPKGLVAPRFEPTVTMAEPIGEVDLSEFQVSGDVQTQVTNVRFSSVTGAYQFDLQLKNNGEGISRDAIVLFPNLPDGVEMPEASGVDVNGDPYVNLQEALPFGGLARGIRSRTVSLAFSNPQSQRFILEPQVMVKGPNQAPEWTPIAPLSVNVGGFLTVSLEANDANEDLVFFKINSAGDLPTGELDSAGGLVFTPEPGQEGTYQFELIADDGVLSSRQTISLEVTNDLGNTRLSGTIQNTRQEPLADVQIDFGSHSTTTGADGSFRIDLGNDEPLPDETLRVHGDTIPGDDVYPFIAEPIDLLLLRDSIPGANNVIGRLIYLPALDMAKAATIDPAVDTTVNAIMAENEAPVEVKVKAGTLLDQDGSPYTGQLSITEVPPHLTPAALPENLHPSLVVTIQPGEMNFTQPAPISLPNRGSYPPGTVMDLWSINPVTGAFDKVGATRVSADGSLIETVTGGIRNSSWHFTLIPELIDAISNLAGNSQDGCDNQCVETEPLSSDVELHSGAIIETHNLVTYQSQGQTRGVQLVYDSLRADPQPIVHFGLQNLTPSSGNFIAANVTVGRGDFEFFAGFPGQPLVNRHGWQREDPSDDTAAAALQIDLRSEESGVYEYRADTQIGNPVEVCVADFFNCDRFITALDGVSVASTGQIAVVNSMESPFGAGWGIAGLQRLFENPDGSVLLVDGDGGEMIFDPPTETDSTSFVSPPDDFSVLSRNEDGTFQRRLKNGTMFRFDDQHRLETVTDRNSNQTTYDYDAVGRITKITDPVGLETIFAYETVADDAENNTLTKIDIMDPASRTTTLLVSGEGARMFDSEGELQDIPNGDLIRVTDPDGTSRNWEYDANHHMIQETDKRGFVEQTLYDSAGRATAAIRKDGSQVQVQPLQTRGLYPVQETMIREHDPFRGGSPAGQLRNSPFTGTSELTESAYVDANGNVTTTELNAVGELVVQRDAIGLVGGAQRDENNLLVAGMDGNGNVTTFDYDDRGNIIKISDAISNKAISWINDSGGDWHNPNNWSSGTVPGPDDDVIIGLTGGDYTIDLRLTNDRQLAVKSLTIGGVGRQVLAWRLGNSTEVQQSVAEGILIRPGGELNFLGASLGELPVPRLQADIRNDGTLQVRGNMKVDGSLEIGPSGRVDMTADSPLANSAILRLSGDVINDGTIEMENALTGTARNVGFIIDEGGQLFNRNLVHALPRTQSNVFIAGNFANHGTLRLDGGMDIFSGAGSGNDNGIWDIRQGVIESEFGFGVNVFGGTTIIEDPASLPPSLFFVSVGRSKDGGFANLDPILQLAEDTILPSGFQLRTGSATLKIFGPGNLTVGEGAVYDMAREDEINVHLSIDGEWILGWSESGSLTLNQQVRISESGVATFPTANNIVITGGIINNGLMEFRGPQKTVRGGGRLLNRGILRIESTTFFEIDNVENQGQYLIDGFHEFRRAATTLTNSGLIRVGDTGTFRVKRTRIENRSGGVIEIARSREIFSNGGFARIDNNDGAIIRNSGDSRMEGEWIVENSGIIQPGGPGQIGRLTIVGNLVQQGSGTLQFDLAERRSDTIEISSDGDPQKGNIDLAGTLDIRVLSGEMVAPRSFGFMSFRQLSGQFSETTFGDGLTGDLSLSINSVSFEATNTVTGTELPPPELIPDPTIDDPEFPPLVGPELPTLGQPAQLIAPTSPGRRFTYDSTFNRLTSVTDELGRKTHYGIDPVSGNRISVRRVVGEIDDEVNNESNDVVTSYTHTSQGLLQTVTDPLGRVDSYDYDDFGRLERITFAIGTQNETSRTFEYTDLSGLFGAMVDENGNRTELEYDDLNRLTRLIQPDPDGVIGPLEQPITTFTYDDAGNQIATIDAKGNETRYEYDSLNRLTRQINADPDGGGEKSSPVTLFSFDQKGNITSLIDPLGNESQFLYDQRDRQIEIIDAEGAITQMTYYPDDSLQSIIDAVGNRTVFEYDSRSRIVREIDPLENTIDASYDQVNNLVSRTDRNGREITYSYDEIDRLTTETWTNLNDLNANTITYDYDLTSNLTRVQDNFSSLDYTYDDLDRVKTVDNLGTPGVPNVMLTYGYDSYGNVMSVADQIDGASSVLTSYEYDALNRTILVVQSGSEVTDKRVDFSYNSIGQLDSLDRFSDVNGERPVVGTTYSYDSLNRLTDLRHTNVATDIAFYNFEYDQSSRIHSITDVDGLSTFAYDDRNQLIAVDHSDLKSPDESYNYDANGNRVSSHIHDNQYETGTANRLISDGEFTYQYDNEGNLILRTGIATGTVREFLYDHGNRLIAVVDKDSDGNESQTVKYTYDAFDRRISKTIRDAIGESTSYFVYDGEDVILDFEEIDRPDARGAELDRRYLHGPGIDQVLAQESVDSDTWLLTDHLGTVRDLVDMSGDLQNHIRYDAFGNIISQSNENRSTRYSFTGREFDPHIGLHYYRARFYDSKLGRFVSEDPAGFAGLDSNLFRYVHNRPSEFSDPTGNISKLGVGSAAIGVAGVAIGIGAIVTAPVSAPVSAIAALAVGIAGLAATLLDIGVDEIAAEESRINEEKAGQEGFQKGFLEGQLAADREEARRRHSRTLHDPPAIHVTIKIIGRVPSTQAPDELDFEQQLDDIECLK